MDAKLADRVKESTTTTGTGPIALGGAPPGFKTFLAGIGDGNYCYYAIVHRTLPEWEVGRGGVIVGGTTLDRGTVYDSTNAKALVNFSAGTKDVFVTIPAAVFDQLGGGDLGTGHGRLVYETTTRIAFRPFNGRGLPVKDPSGWRNRSIGAGIVSGNPGSTVRVNGVPNQGLTANTTYLVTVLDVAGALEFDFLTNLAHETDAATGVDIGQANDSHTVVGMVRTPASQTFVDSLTQRFVLSWFNRRARDLTNVLTAARTVTTPDYPTWGEVHPEIRCEFLTWADEAVTLMLSGSFRTTTNTGVAHGAVGVDNVTALADSAMTLAGAGITDRDQPLSISTARTFADGYHYATVLACSQGSGIPTVMSAGSTVTALTRLSATIRG